MNGRNTFLNRRFDGVGPSYFYSSGFFSFFLLHPTLKQITNFHIISTFGRSVFFTIIMIFYFDHFSILHSVDLKFHLHYTTNSFPLHCGFMNRNFIFISHCFPFRWMVLYCLVWCVCVFFIVVVGSVLPNDVAKFAIVVAIHLITIHFHFTNELEYLNSLIRQYNDGPYFVFLFLLFLFSFGLSTHSKW